MSSKSRDVLINVLSVALVVIIAAAVIFGIIFLGRICCNPSEEIVSGIVYDAEFDTWPKGNTSFKVRASAEMAVTEDTSKTYCLPPNSPYEELVREAAADKDVKVVVRAKKFSVRLRDDVFTCIDNVEVTRKEQK